MILNSKITSDINQWHIAHDPYGFTQNEDWLRKAEKTEDILQLQHVYAEGPILDVGWYNGIYRAVIVVEENWEEPIEKVESESENVVSDMVYKWLGQFANVM